MKQWLGMTVCAVALNAGGVAIAEEPPKNCLDTFRTPEFQALDLREPHGVIYLLDFFGPLKGQSCTLDQIEAFFNAKHGVTIYRSQTIVTFRATLNTSGFFFKEQVTIGTDIKEGKINNVAVANAK